MNIYYHRTDAAEAILLEGFRDNNGLVGAYSADIEGVFLSDIPLDCNTGAKGKQLLEVRLPIGCDISYYEIVEEDAEGKPYREWCVPAALINRHGQIRMVSDEEEEELYRRLMGWTE